MTYIYYSEGSGKLPTPNQLSQTIMSYSPSLSDLKFEYDEYLAWFVDNGQEPLSFEEFCKKEGYAL